MIARTAGVSTMSRDVLQTLLRAGRVLAAGDDPAAALGRFAAGDTAAFAALVGRYGPLVLGVCRRVLGPTPDAEDAFQATFLALLRHARSIRDPGALPGWLHRTALNAALKARGRARPVLDPAPEPVAPADPLAEASWREVRCLLDEELNALPERLRGPLVLCYLEARAHAEAARSLGVSVSTLKRRLDRGREVLRRRLVRRGIGAAGLAAAVLGGTGLAAPVPAALFRAAAGLAAGGGRVRPAVATLALLGGAGVPHARPLPVLACLLLAAAAGGLLLGGAGEPPAAAVSDPQSAAPEPGGVAGPRGDVLGDPLPEGALARLGTGRLRGYRCRFLPDGRRVVRERADGGLQIYEVPTGRPLATLRGTDVPGRKEIIGSTIAFTRDSKYLAAVCWEGRCGIWETATGRLVRWLESGPFYSVVECDFSPDGKLLAVGRGAPEGRTQGIRVGVYEVESGRQLPINARGTNSAFAPDGKSLVVWYDYDNGRKETARRLAVPGGEVLGTYGYQGGDFGFTPRSDGAWLFDVSGGALRARDLAGGAEHNFSAPCFGRDKVVYVCHRPGRRELIVVGTRPAGVWAWDLETGKELWQTRLAAPAYFPPLSGDGGTLVTGEEKGSVRVWDAATGKERVSFRPDAIGHVSHLQVSPDGKTVATNSPGSHFTTVAFWDAVTGKRLSDLPGHPSGVTAAAYAPDGSRVYTLGKDRTLRAWDPATGRELSRVPAEPAEYLAVSPDGKALCAAGPDGTVRVLDAGTGKVERRLAVFAKGLVGMALTADGKSVIAAGRDGEEGGERVRVCDAGTGARLREFGRADARLEQLAVRADGGAVATTHLGRRVILWDPAGKKLLDVAGRGQRGPAWPREGPTFLIGSVGLSADGRWLAYSDQEQGVAVVDTRTGQEVSRAKPDVYYQNPAARYEVRDVLAFAPDGKTVAWSGVESTSDVFLIEARTGGVRRRLPGDSYPVEHLLFAPDGSTLLSAGPDGSALVWDIFGRLGGKPGDLAADAAAGWWERLADRDAAKAYAAMREMAGHPAAALALLREQLKPVREVPAAKLGALLAGLDAAEFGDREAATRELVALGDAVEARLRQALRQAKGPEVKRRVEAALEQIAEGRLRPERAVEVLEVIGDGASRDLLRELAGGLAGAPGSLDAAGALARLNRAGSRGGKP
jgi:RNA polymerase sigma factor (sigma-70 family)